MQAFLSGVEVRFYAGRRKVERFLAGSPTFELIAGRSRKVGKLSDLPLSYRGLFGWKSLGRVESRYLYSVADTFVLRINPSPKMKVRVRWRLQLVHIGGTSQVECETGLGELLHV